MKAFVLGCVAALVIAIAGMMVLDRLQEPVAQAFATTGVILRVGRADAVPGEPLGTVPRRSPGPW